MQAAPVLRLRVCPFILFWRANYSPISNIAFNSRFSLTFQCAGARDLKPENPGPTRAKRKKRITANAFNTGKAPIYSDE
jgi:hypothetical protein